MSNQEIKQEMRQNKIPQWKVAAEMGVSEMTLIRKMRFELSDTEKQRIRTIIASLSTQN